MSEPFNLKKLLGSAGDPMWYVKSGSLGIPWIVLAFLAFTMYTAYFKKKPDTNRIVAKEGSVVNIIEKSKRLFIPFVELYADQPSNEDIGAGIRAGLRFEF